MNRSGIKRRPLADSVLKTLEPEDKPYRELDSPGLYFQVTVAGGKSWLLRYKNHQGKWTWFGLGKFPKVSGKEARGLAADWLERIDAGEDPKAAPVEEARGLTFMDIAEYWLDRKEALGRTAKSRARMRAHLDNDIYPVIGRKPVDQVTRGDCAEIVQRISDRNARSMAEKVAGWLRQIYSLAIAEGKCELNPASELRTILPAYQEQHHPFLLESELSQFLRDLEASTSTFNTLVLVHMTMTTLCRPSMARLAQWSEIDLDAGEWTVPAERMKMRREFVSPLASQTIERLRHLKAITGRQPYLFPSYGPKHPVQSENSVNKAIGRIGWKGRIVGHGFRHTGSTLLREHGWAKDYVETQLAHAEGGVAGVYNKAQYLKQRKVMVQWYADYLDALREGMTPEKEKTFTKKLL